MGGRARIGARARTGARARIGAWPQIGAPLVRRAALLAIALLTMRTAEADVLHTLEVLRVGGCGGTQPAAPALAHQALLDRVAAGWSSGRPLATVAADSGYSGVITTAWHTRDADPSMLRGLKRTGCRLLADRDLREVGLYQRAQDLWVVLGTPSSAALSHPPSSLASRVLDLVNAARARGTQCGSRSFAPAPPVALSSTLGGVALGHATDMAEHGYFEHEDLSGRTPADRVRAAGYREKLVGENIAYGPQTPDEVVQGWLDSPGHCENIMDPRFGEMGIAYAPGRAARRGLYWVQLLAAPRA